MGPKGNDIESKPGEEKEKEKKDDKVIEKRSDGRGSSSGSGPSSGKHIPGKSTSKSPSSASIKRKSSAEPAEASEMFAQLMKGMKDIGDRLDVHASAIDELRLSNATVQSEATKSREPKTKKPRLLPTASYNDDENYDDEDMEEEEKEDGDYFDGDNVLSDGEILEEDDGYDAKKALLGSKKKGAIKCSPEDDEIFAERTKLGPEFSAEEWMEVRASSTVKFWLANNRQFDAPKADCDTPDLKYANRRSMEKALYEIHRMLGCINLQQITIVRRIDDMGGDILKTREEFLDSAVQIDDPRQDAADTLVNIRDSLAKVMQDAAAVGRTATAAFNKILRARREQYIDSVDASATAKALVKKLKPSTSYLFGEQLREVCRTLKEGSNLTSALQKPKKPTYGNQLSGQPYGRGGGGGRGAGQGGYRGAGGNRGSFRGARGSFRKKE